jgi:hypothetical protein
MGENLMLKYIFIAVVIFQANLAFGEKLLGRTPVIDEYQKKIDIAFRNEVMACEKKEKNITRQFMCTENLQKEYRKRQIWYRGSQEYCEKNYLGLPNKKLHEIYEKLQKECKVARMSSVIRDYDNPPGEISMEKLKAEISHIKVELYRRGQPS